LALTPKNVRERGSILCRERCFDRWVRFYGGDFIIFRPKVIEFWIAFHHWKSIQNLNFIFFTIGLYCQVFTLGIVTYSHEFTPDQPNRGHT
jgi:hypothetical protein